MIFNIFISLPFVCESFLWLIRVLKNILEYPSTRDPADILFQTAENTKRKTTMENYQYYMCIQTISNKTFFEILCPNYTLTGFPVFIFSPFHLTVMLLVITVTFDLREC